MNQANWQYVPLHALPPQAYMPVPPTQQVQLAPQPTQPPLHPFYYDHQAQSHAAVPSNFPFFEQQFIQSQQHHSSTPGTGSPSQSSKSLNKTLKKSRSSEQMRAGKAEAMVSPNVSRDIPVTLSRGGLKDEKKLATCIASQDQAKMQPLQNFYYDMYSQPDHFAILQQQEQQYHRYMQNQLLLLQQQQQHPQAMLMMMKAASGNGNAGAAQNGTSMALPQSFQLSPYSHENITMGQFGPETYAKGNPYSGSLLPEVAFDPRSQGMLATFPPSAGSGYYPTPQPLSATKPNNVKQAHRSSAIRRGKKLRPPCPVCKGPGRHTKTKICSTCYGGVYNDITKVCKVKNEHATLHEFLAALKALPRGCTRNNNCKSHHYSFEKPPNERCTQCRTIAISKVAPELIVNLLNRRQERLKSGNSTEENAEVDEDAVSHSNDSVNDYHSLSPSNDLSTLKRVKLDKRKNLSGTGTSQFNEIGCSSGITTKANEEQSYSAQSDANVADKQQPKASLKVESYPVTLHLSSAVISNIEEK